MIKIILLVIFFIALRAFRPARAELAPSGRVTIYTRPDHWLYPLGRHDRARFDVPYAGEASTPEQILHIVYPETGEGPFPLVVFVHGGGWSLFNSQNHEIVYTGEMPLAALGRGYAVAYIDYRLTNTRIMPEQLYDVKAAVRFLRANAREYALVPDQIVLSGDSAGAHLAALAALTADQEAFEDPERLNPETSCAVQAVISWFGIMDFSGDMSELLGWFYGLDSASLTVEDIASLSRMCSPVRNVLPRKSAALLPSARAERQRNALHPKLRPLQRTHDEIAQSAP